MLGIDNFLSQAHRFMGLSFALFANQASFTSSLIPSELALGEIVNLVGIIAPQHGFYHEAQANMRENPSRTHPLLKIPIHPFYSSSPQLPPFMEEFDVLLVDIQDVGVRVYTYIWSLLILMRKLSGSGKVIFILDRPNPLGGELIEGRPLEEEFSSLVGLVPIPMIHGMTVGEMALMFRQELSLNLEVEIFRAEWRRDLKYPDLDFPWRNPSPNLPSFSSVLVYGGTVMFEGTNISEGRGTTRPFQYIGAPFIDPYELWRQVGKIDGAELFPIGFTPTFDKYQGKECFGLEIIPKGNIRPLRTGLIIAKRIFSMWKEAAFLSPPYEYEQKKLPFDIITGSDAFRKWIEEGHMADLEPLLDPGDFPEKRRDFLFYP